MKQNHPLYRQPFGFRILFFPRFPWQGATMITAVRGKRNGRERKLILSYGVGMRRMGWLEKSALCKNVLKNRIKYNMPNRRLLLKFESRRALSMPLCIIIKQRNSLLCKTPKLKEFSFHVPLDWKSYKFHTECAWKFDQKKSFVFFPPNLNKYRLF